MWFKKNPDEKYWKMMEILGSTTFFFSGKKKRFTQQVSSIFKDRAHLLSETFFFSGKKKRSRTQYLHHFSIFFVRIFFKPHLLDLKTPFLGLPVTFRHPGKRYRPLKWPSRHFWEIFWQNQLYSVFEALERRIKGGICNTWRHQRRWKTHTKCGADS